MSIMLKRLSIFLNYKDLLKQLVFKDLKLKYPPKLSRLYMERTEPLAGYDCNGCRLLHHVQP